MTAIKTRIWQGGLAAITGDGSESTKLVPVKEQLERDPALHPPIAADGALAAADAELQDTAMPGETGFAAGPRALANTLPGIHDPARGSTTVQGWWEVRSASALAEHQRMSLTRIMPIEALLGRNTPGVLPAVLDPEPEHPVARAQATRPSTPARPAPKLSDSDDQRDGSFDRHPAARSTSNPLRIGLLLACCAVAAYLCLLPPGGMASVPPPSTTQAAKSMPNGPHAAQRMKSTASQPAAASAAAQPATGAAADSGSIQTLRPRVPGRERAAIDALVAGDFVRAHSLYSELSDTVAGPSAFSEAARILSERARLQQQRPGSRERR